MWIFTKENKNLAIPIHDGKKLFDERFALRDAHDDDGDKHLEANWLLTPRVELLADDGG